MESNGKPNAYSDRPDDAKLAVRAHLCALLLERRVVGKRVLCCATRADWRALPGVLVHGRLDMGSPVNTAWELTKVWPDAELVVISDSGHTGSKTMANALNEALTRFAKR